MKISPARTAAFDILKRIDEDRAFSSTLLPIYEEILSRADAALCHEITLGVLRRRIYLDRLIDSKTGKKKLDSAVRISLRMGLYQLTALGRVPNYSAVNESVDLVSRAKKNSAKGLVNAVLRRFLRDPIEPEYSDEIDRISVTTSHPRWLIEKWAADFGHDVAAKIAEANNAIPSTAFRVIREGPDVDSLIENSRPSRFVEGCWIANDLSGPLRALADDGSIYIQDEGSQIVAGTVSLPQAGRFLDVCAAPGGKTGLVARKYEDATLIAAGDFHWKRVEHLKKNTIMQGGSGAAILQYDGLMPLPFADASFDSVLVDAPCSGTGTIRHNPEIRYFLSENDFEALQSKQLEILENASKTVVIGGELVYSTCSLESEENEQVAQKFLTRNPGFTVESSRVADELRTNDGFGRTWPWRDAMDGFFIAVFRRRD